MWAFSSLFLQQETENPLTEVSVLPSFCLASALQWAGLAFCSYCREERKKLLLAQETKVLNRTRKVLRVRDCTEHQIESLPVPIFPAQLFTSNLTRIPSIYLIKNKSSSTILLCSPWGGNKPQSFTTLISSRKEQWIYRASSCGIRPFNAQHCLHWLRLKSFISPFNQEPSTGDVGEWTWNLLYSKQIHHAELQFNGSLHQVSKSNELEEFCRIRPRRLRLIQHPAAHHRQSDASRKPHKGGMKALALHLRRPSAPSNQTQTILGYTAFI